MRIPEYVKEYVYDTFSKDPNDYERNYIVPKKKWFHEEFGNPSLKNIDFVFVDGPLETYGDLMNALFYHFGTDDVVEELVEYGVRYFKERPHALAAVKKAHEEISFTTISSLAKATVKQFTAMYDPTFEVEANDDGPLV